MRISDWSSDVCSSDLRSPDHRAGQIDPRLIEPRLRGDHLGICLDGRIIEQRLIGATRATGRSTSSLRSSNARSGLRNRRLRDARRGLGIAHFMLRDRARPGEALPRSEEHTSELPSLMRTSYPDFCLKKKTTYTKQNKDV